jgi:hypothetical protein
MAIFAIHPSAFAWLRNDLQYNGSAGWRKGTMIRNIKDD